MSVFFLQMASHRLQSAEKIGMRFFLALPGLKSGARHWCFRTGQKQSVFGENNVQGEVAAHQEVRPPSGCGPAASPH